MLCFHLAPLKFMLSLYSGKEAFYIMSAICILRPNIRAPLCQLHCLYHAREIKLLLLLEGVPLWLTSYGRRKQQHLHGQWLPVELELSLLAHGILFKGTRRKSTVKLPSTTPLPPNPNINIKITISLRLSQQNHSAQCEVDLKQKHFTGETSVAPNHLSEGTQLRNLQTDHGSLIQYQAPTFN